MNIDAELKIITDSLYHMYDYTLNNLKVALTYFLGRDNYDPNLKIDDDIINDFERDVESLCMQILLKERAYAGDLRAILGYLKLVEDIERIADQAYDIKNCADDIKKNDRDDKVEEINKMVDIVYSMVKEAFEALVRMDVKTADNIIKRDDIVDKMYLDIENALIELTEKKVITPYESIKLISVTKYLERIADQTTNISEWTIYIVNGFHKDKVVI